MNVQATETRPGLGAQIRGTGGEKENRPKFALATEIDRAIDLSCRACGAGAWALGLDSRWGSPLRSVFTPNLRLEHHQKQQYVQFAVD